MDVSAIHVCQSQKSRRSLPVLVGVVLVLVAVVELGGHLYLK